MADAPDDQTFEGSGDRKVSEQHESKPMVAGVPSNGGTKESKAYEESSPNKLDSDGGKHEKKGDSSGPESEEKKSRRRGNRRGKRSPKRSYNAEGKPRSNAAKRATSREPGAKLTKKDLKLLKKEAAETLTVRTAFLICFRFFCPSIRRHPCNHRL